MKTKINHTIDFISDNDLQLIKGLKDFCIKNRMRIGVGERQHEIIISFRNSNKWYYINTQYGNRHWIIKNSFEMDI